MLQSGPWAVWTPAFFLTEFISNLTCVICDYNFSKEEDRRVPSPLICNNSCSSIEMATLHEHVSSQSCALCIVSKEQKAV